ncbi:MAG: nuclease [Clostridia bacterium]|nr:nuclease [Clostridia bacterium]
MRRKGLSLLILFVFFMPCCLFAEWAVVRYVHDGDTIILENDERVRLIGVDTPEVKSKYREHDEYYGPEARAYLKGLIEGKRVNLKDPEMQGKFDKYGRRLAYVYTEDDLFVNRELVRLGYAEAIRYFPYKYKKQFLKLEKQAKKQKLGMWG